MESQFTGSPNSDSEVFFNNKYIGGGIREHILKTRNMSSKLKPMEMELPNAFVVHLVLASLPKEFETIVVNYNITPKQ